MIAQDTRIFLILLQNKANAFLKIFKTRNWARIFVFFCFLLIAAFLGLSLYFFSVNTFWFLTTYPEFLQSMLFYIFVAWFFLIFFLTLGSGLISALDILFVQDDDHLLLSFPIRPQVIFESRLVNLLVFSCWPVIVFGAPLLLAFKQTFQLSFSFFLASFLALILVLLIAVLIASILALKIISLSGRVGKNLVSALTLIGLPLLAWWVTNILVPPDLVESFHKLQLEEINQFLRSLPINSKFFPSTWVVNFIFYWQDKPFLAFMNLGNLFLFLAWLGGFVYLLVNKEYFADMAQVRVGHFVAGPHDRPKPFLAKRLFRAKGIKAAFLEKDFLTLVRDRPALLQGAFILFIVLLFFLILGRVPLAKLENNPHLSLDQIAQMTFVFGGYILAILGLRFFFPGMSLEGQSGWLIWSAPFAKAKLLGQKLLTGWGFLSLMGVILAFFTTWILKLGWPFFISSTLVYIGLSLVMASINVGLGALLPNFEEKNAEKLSTSPGGILATGISFLYILAVNLIFFLKPGIFPHLFVWLSAIFLTLFFYSLSLARIKRYQF